MKDALKKVAAFQQKHGFDQRRIELQGTDEKFAEFMRIAQHTFENFHNRFEGWAKTNTGVPNDKRALRLALIVEELAELVEALNTGNEAETLDALADLLYVVIGAGYTFDLPLAEAFEEVHASNMTKAVRNPGDLRLRNKGADYLPPKLASILAAYRAKQDVTDSLKPPFKRQDSLQTF